MGLTALQIFLWLLPALTPTTQELVTISTSPKMTAECGKHVTLNCNVSSSRNVLSVKYMEWSLNKISLCSVDSEGKMTKHHIHTLSDFHCKYTHGQLSLILHNVRPLESANANYRCKLQSEQGAGHRYTTVELQECCGTVEGVVKSDHCVCTFKRVYPGGDVHWFRGSHNLTDQLQRYTNTTKHVDQWGWWTIRGYLEQNCSDEPYNCSLMSTKSGRYIASTLVQNSLSLLKTTHESSKGAGSLGPVRTLLCILILLAVTMK